MQKQWMNSRGGAVKWQIRKLRDILNEMNL
jgi:hypothetical protein